MNYELHPCHEKVLQISSTKEMHLFLSYCQSLNDFILRMISWYPR